MDQDRFLDQLVTACIMVEDLEDLWNAALDFYHAHAFSMVSYHHVDPSDADGRYVTVRADGFPASWVCQYVGQRLYLIDPVPELAAHMGHPFKWSDVRQMITQSPGNARYLSALEAAHLGDGLAVQVFGPNLRTGYFGLGFGNGMHPLDEMEIAGLQCAAQLVHLRYCDLCALDAPPSPHLAPREKEILEWMARGKSNLEIAQILGLSRHTVDTLARRVFEKLSVNDRTTAAVRGLGSGLLQFQRLG